MLLKDKVAIVTGGAQGNGTGNFIEICGTGVLGGCGGSQPRPGPCNR